ncbi:MAG: glycosyltransferase [Acidimicrobiales bacterium]
MTSWRPVPILQFDLDTQQGSRVDAQPGDRVWVEVMKSGCVVGVVDAIVDEGGLSPTSALEIAVRFRDAQPSTLPRLPDSELPRASVIVPTLCRNPPELVRLVDSLLDLDYPSFEVILVDNRAPGGPPLPEFGDPARVHVFVETRRGASAARNMGIAMATGDILAFTDDDAVVNPSWLRVLATRFATEPDVEGIGGLVLPVELHTPAQLWFEEFYGGFSPSYQFEKLSVESMKGVDPMFPYAVGRFGAGCNMAFRRSTLQRIGGFNPIIGGGTIAKGGEDVALAIELVSTGGTYAYEPAAVVRHTHRRTECEFMQQVFNYGTGLTAMYSAMIMRDPRHLLSIARTFPAGFRHLTRSAKDRSPSSAPSYPKKTVLVQILGLLYGPLAYIRSILSAR